MKRHDKARSLLLCVSLALAVSPALSELEYEVGDLPGIVFVNPEDPSPWPTVWDPVRQHVPGYRLLNVDGDLREDGEPDFMINLATGNPEAVWAMNVGGTYQIAHSVWTGSGWSEPVLLTSSSENNLDPRLTILEGGGLGVTWWREETKAQVFHALRESPTTAFGAESPVSSPGEHATHPSIASVDSTTFLGYEQVESGFRTVIVERQEGTGSFAPEVIATTTRQECLEVHVHQAGGKIWVDWIDSGSYLVWSRRTSSGWESPSFEPYAGPDDLARARLAIKGKAIR